MIATTEYKSYQIILELVTAVLYVGWFVAGILIYNFDPPAEGEILKQNCMLASLIATATVYLLFSTWSILPANNSLIRTRKYDDGIYEYRLQCERRFRNIAYIIKLVLYPAIVYLGLYNYYIYMI